MIDENAGAGWRGLKWSGELPVAAKFAEGDAIFVGENISRFFVP